MSEDLPKQELLIKLLKMTTSSNDGEAVIAVRKANDLLKSAGWDWERLIQGKIKVIEDPFKSVSTPDQFNGLSRAPKAPPPAPPSPPRPQTAQSFGSGGGGGGSYTGRFSPGAGAGGNPQQAPRGSTPRQPPRPYSTKDNLYRGWCYCCGTPVDAKAGWIFDPATHNQRATSKWQILCNDCNKNNAFVPPSAALRKRQMVSGATPGLGDI